MFVKQELTKVAEALKVAGFEWYKITEEPAFNAKFRNYFYIRYRTNSDGIDSRFVDKLGCNLYSVEIDAYGIFVTTCEDNTENIELINNALAMQGVVILGTGTDSSVIYENETGEKFTSTSQKMYKVAFRIETVYRPNCDIQLNQICC